MSLNWNPLKATLLLPVSNPEIPERISSHAASFGFVRKPEFHLSIISFQNGKKIAALYGGNEEMLDKIRALADRFSWNAAYAPEYSVIEKYYDSAELEKSGYENIPEHARKTIVQKALLPDLEKFYEELSRMTAIDFDVPFSHLTLFSWSDYAPMMSQGIGLYSESDFDRYRTETI